MSFGDPYKVFGVEIDIDEIVENYKKNKEKSCKEKNCIKELENKVNILTDALQSLNSLIKSKNDEIDRMKKQNKNIVEPPCKIGDVFMINDEDDEPYIVVSFECDSESDWSIGFTEYGHNCCTNFMSFKDFLSDCKIADLEE